MTDETLPRALLPGGATGVDAGLTLTKLARATRDGVVLTLQPPGGFEVCDGGSLGVTGARAAAIKAPDAVPVPEIDAGVYGALALMQESGRPADSDFVLAFTGTGTSFAAVRLADRLPVIAHLGGTAMGGGSFYGIARRLAPHLTYPEILAAAERGDRRAVDTMVGDAYPEGIGRIGGDLTAAHLAASREGSLEDLLASLLNLHAENIGQIAASRATVVQLRRIIVAGGFAHNNIAFTQSFAKMCGLFGVGVEVAPSPGYAGAIGAAIIAAERQGGTA